MMVPRAFTPRCSVALRLFGSGTFSPRGVDAVLGWRTLRATIMHCFGFVSLVLFTAVQ